VSGKPQFARGPQESGKSFSASTTLIATPVSNGQTNEAPPTEPVSGPTLNRESLAILRQFFDLLDAWDRQEEQS
jgi:hypothetical protein